MDWLRRWLPWSSRRTAERAVGDAAPARPTPIEPRTCPYCLARFERPPLQDLDCPECGEHVWVMRDRETGGRLLLTKEQAEALREEDERLCSGAATQGLRERWLHELEESHGVLAADFERERRGISGELGDRAVIWRLLDLLVEQKKDYAELVDLYERRARFADECKQEFAGELRRARALELLDFKKEGDVEYVRIRASGCPTCARSDGTRLPIERAMHSMPLPLAECSCRAPHTGRAGFCRARYERDFSR